MNDEPRLGRLKTAVTQENVEAVRDMVKSDPRVTYLEIEAHLGIGSASAQTIFKVHLRLSKRCAQWIPHNLTEQQKETMVEWCIFMLEKFSGRAGNNV